MIVSIILLSPSPWKIKAYLTAVVRLWCQSLISCWSVDINNSVLCGKES